MPGRISAVLFDLDGTLLDDDASLQACVRRVYEDVCRHLPDMDAMAMVSAYIRFDQAFWANRQAATRAYSLLDLVQEARLTIWTHTMAYFGCEDPAVVLQARDAYAQYRSEVCLTYDDALDVLEAVHGRYRLAVVTNGLGEQQRARIRRSGLEPYFDAVVASTDVNAGKPEPAVFEHALGLLSASPGDAWHIGDSLVSDIAGARNAGLAAAVWLNRDGRKRGDTDPQPHHEVGSLREFAALLDRFES
jgi:putative hydrolase of the HAD superfamily